MKKITSECGRQRGFTLLEAALVVLIMGLFLATIMATRSQSASQSSASETILMDTATAALFQYAKRNNRLPCPDVNGDGHEDASNGICTTGAHTGGIPYLTLGISLSSPVGTGVDRQFVYGVFRGGSATDKDLTLSSERSIPPHVSPNTSYNNLDDFKQALVNAANAPSGAVDASNLYVTGNDANSGAADCSNNKVANVAFVVAFAGLRNADETGSDFDGPNLLNGGWSDSTRWNSVVTTTCFAGPGKPITDRYDDQVRAFSFTELMGFLAR